MKERLNNYLRVLSIARKPDKEEFVITSKVCALGISIVGVIGFVIFLLFILLGI